MNAPRRIGLCRGAAVVLASGVAISLMELSIEIVPALADPPLEPTVIASETAYATTTEYPPVTPTDEPVLTEPVLTPEPAPPTVAMTTSDSASTTTTTSFSSSSTTSTTGTTTQTSTKSSTTSSVVVSTTSDSAIASPAITTSDAALPTPSNTAQPAQATPTVEPQRLQAAPQDVELAQAAVPVPQNPDPASQSEIDHIRGLLATGQTPGTNIGPDSVAENSGANSDVLQWQPDWVRHDNNFRPVIFNPFRDPLQIVYVDRGNPRILTIPPLTSALMDLAQGAYGITVMALDAVGQPKNVAVGNVFSGKPPDSYTNVPVVVKYTDATYKPIVVGQITDVGDDPNVGERKVLLDGATPAWGRWTETPSGERQFEVNKTQQFPGIDTPAEGKLPGRYPLQLASASEPTSGLPILFLIILAVVAGLGASAIAVRIRRAKQRPRHGRQGTRIQAVSRPGGPPVVTVRETQAPGEKTHAIRLAAHTDPGALTIREVDDDHTRAE